MFISGMAHVRLKHGPCLGKTPPMFASNMGHVFLTRRRCLHDATAMSAPEPRQTYPRGRGTRSRNAPYVDPILVPPLQGRTHQPSARRGRHPGMPARLLGPYHPLDETPRLTCQMARQRRTRLVWRTRREQVRSDPVITRPVEHVPSARRSGVGSNPGVVLVTLVY